VNPPAIGRAAAPGGTRHPLATPGSAEADIPRAVPRGAEAIRRLNSVYLMAAREAAQDDISYAIVAFGVSRTFAAWLAAAPIDAILDLAALPACVFSLRLPERAMEPAQLGRLGSPGEGVRSRVALHTVLAGLPQAER
jgi:hypothetical protein